MNSFPWIALGISLILAVVPVIIWLKLLPSEGFSRMLYVKIFLLGTLSVIPPFILIFLFDKYPSLDIYRIIKTSLSGLSAAVLTNIVVGIVEEIGKHEIVTVVDKRHPEYIQTTGSALRLSICAGLGFSFAENIFYFYNIWSSSRFGFSDRFATFVFRSAFTMLGHMVFSGIYGYFFGIGKFAADITEHARWQGRRLIFARLISRISGKMTFEVVKKMKALTGLAIAIALHSSFNASLDMNHKLPSIFIVVGSAIFIFYLIKSDTGHLTFSVTKRRESTMAQRDEEAVIELLGMWTKQGKLKEVIEICDRLLARDPDNNVVKLFRAHAMDDQKLRHVYESLKAVFKKTGVPSGSPAAQAGGTQMPALSPQDEKVILEVMDQWYREGNFGKVLDVANKLLAKNPQSSGAKLLMQKALDSNRLSDFFNSISSLFQGS